MDSEADFLRAIDLSPEDIGIIVSNPPYAADGDEVDPEVRNHEPRAAWQALVERHLTRLVGFAWHVLGDRAEAEDVALEVEDRSCGSLRL